MLISLLLLSLRHVLADTSCNVKAVSVPLRDVQVLADVSNSFVKGISLQIGTPPQQIVALPWPELNNTWLYDYQPYCDNTIIFSDTMCKVRRGGFYYENASSTFDQAIDVVAAGGAAQEAHSQGLELGIPGLISTSVGGSDAMSLLGSSPGPNVGLPTMPVGIPRSNWDHGYTILHAIGMGSNSTLLNRLVETQQISSRAWSIFWGRMWTSNDLDGSVVLGGFDKDKVLGANVTQPLDYSDGTGCYTGMRVTISDIFLHSASGSTTSIFAGPLSMPACIVPQQQLLLGAVNDVRDNFDKATGMKSIGDSFGIHWGARVYNSTNAFGGDMSIRLSSGLQIRVPNSQYLPPYVYVDRNGSRLQDGLKRELLVGGLGVNQSATLGRYFLTAAYLMVNHDAGTFTLWQANPSSKSTLVPVISKTSAQGCPGVSGTLLPSSAASSSGSNPTAASTGSAIGGIVGGTVAGMAIIGLLVWYCMRTRRTKTTTSDETTLQIQEQKSPRQGDHHYGALSELYGQPTTALPWSTSEVGASFGPHELDGVTRNSLPREFQRPI